MTAKSSKNVKGGDSALNSNPREAFPKRRSITLVEAQRRRTTEVDRHPSKLNEGQSLPAGNGSPPSPGAAALAPTQSCQEYDWSPAAIAQLSQGEIETIPASILETLPSAVLTQLNERMAELQRLAAMTPEERDAYLQAKAEKAARAEIAQQKTNEPETHALFQWGRTQWDRQLEYWYCLTCKWRFSFKRRRNGRPKPEKCPQCYAKDIEPWAPGEEVGQEMASPRE